jgi:hypothetical protein
VLVVDGPRVGVLPPREYDGRAALFGALEQSFPVRFERREPGDWDRLDAAIVLGPEEAARDSPVPCLVLATSAGERRSAKIELTTAEPLDPVLRGRRLLEHDLIGGAGLTVDSGDTPLAVAGPAAVWVLRAQQPACWVSVAAPRDLAADEGLRDQLRSGHVLGLLPMVHFLRHIAGEDPRGGPPLRSCFVIDDPNLHAPRYGHIRYVQLLEHAHRHGYHIAMASIPLDYWLVHGRTADLFRDGSRHLSLAVHGNNHEGSELLRFPSEEAALAPLAQALRRAAALERRTSVAVSRVMCAPHEECSPATMRAMFRLGFEGLALDPRRDHRGASRTGALGGWAPAQLLDGGLPVVPRYGLPADEDLVLRAYLGLPLILYGHHDDLAGGLDVLAEAATQVNALGDVEWLPLGDIMRTNLGVSLDGDRLTVRLHTRRGSVAVPETVRELVVELPPAASATDLIVRAGRQTADARLAPRSRTRLVFCGPFEPAVELELLPTHPVSVADVPEPARRLQPIVRRVLTEGRDRLAPIGRFTQRSRA